MSGRRTWAALAGVVAVALATVVDELAAALLSPSVSPLTAVGSAVIDLLPAALKEGAISLFGSADKLVLLLIMALVIAVIAALAGVAEYRRRLAGVALILVFSAVGVVAVGSRSESTPAALAAPVPGAVIGVLVLLALTRRLHAWPPPRPVSSATAAPARSAAAHTEEAPSAPAPGPSSRPARDRNEEPGRRKFLQALWGGAAVAVIAGIMASAARGAQLGLSKVRAALTLPAPESRAAPIPADATLVIPGITALVTPNPDFYRIDTALVVPRINPDDWMLKVTGLVRHEVVLSLSDLLAKPLLQRYLTLTCVSNPVGGDLAGNAKWLGWPVRELLAEAQPEGSADMVLSRSADGWTAGTPLEALTDHREALLAVGMNGQPLPFEHGFPVRLVVPGLYGYVSATKWVTELKVTRFADETSYWTDRGWSVRGPIKTASRIDTPRDGAHLDAGYVQFGGVAWAQHRGVKAVQVRADDGPWQQARLAAAISTDTWRQWGARLRLGTGSHTIQVRAMDGTGQLQTARHADPIPNGASGYHSIHVSVG